MMTLEEKKTMKRKREILLFECDISSSEVERLGIKSKSLSVD